MLAIGHSSQYESIYGLGGIGSTSLSDAEHKRHSLMYHDKRFQTDIYFPFIAFSHTQVKASTTGGFLLADKAKFHDVTNRLLNVDQNVLTSLAKRLSEGEVVKPTTKERKIVTRLFRI